MSNSKCIIGLGEILWDLLPAGKQLGGAPANFAYHSAILGNTGITVSRVGDDQTGTEILQRLRQLGLCTDFIQTDAKHDTGVVQVSLDDAGKPDYEIVENVAWDCIEADAATLQLAAKADAVCFGSLAQRAPQSRQAIRSILAASSEPCLRLFDINLRQDYFDAEVLEASLELATALKLNDEELPVVQELFGLDQGATPEHARQVLSRFDLDLVCVTRGGNGSWLLDRSQTHIADGISVAIADTVGAGDAFTAALCHNYLQGRSLDEINERANRLGAWVASQHGATPPADPKVLDSIR